MAPIASVEARRAHVFMQPWWCSQRLHVLLQVQCTTAFPVVYFFFLFLLRLELGRDCLIFPVAEYIDDVNNTRGLSFM